VEPSDYERAKADVGDRTELQKVELRALTGDRQAVIQLVSALRKYRAAVEKMFEHSPLAGWPCESALGRAVQGLSDLRYAVNNIEEEGS
jgi:hypothetical protein